MKTWNKIVMGFAIIIMGCAGTTNNNPVGNDTLVDTVNAKDIYQKKDTNIGTDKGSKDVIPVEDKGLSTDSTTNNDVCTPNCWYKECGDNGCGGTCGQCTNDQQCVKNKCVAKECNLSAFAPAKAGADWKNPGGADNTKGFFTYYELSSNSYPVSQLIIRIRQAAPFAGPTGPGTFQIAGTDIDKDSIQVIGLENCPAAGQACEHYYYGAEGTLEIKDMKGASGPFDAVFHNAKLHEITFDKQTGNMVFVDKGRKWCLDGHEIKADTVQALPKDTCVAQGTGTGFYDNIGDFTLTNCLGEKVNLHSQCGGPDVMWLTVAAKWCPHCKENLPIFWKYYTEHKENVNYWIYLAEGEYGKDPTQAECKAYAQQEGVDPAHMFIGDHSWSIVNRYLNPGTNQIGYPFSFIMLGKNMSYVWSSALGADPRAEIDELLKSK